MNVIKGFGKRLKQAVKESPYTQKKISELLRIDQDTFTNYVKERSFPDAKVLLELCQLLNKTPNWLLTGNNLCQEYLLLEKQADYSTNEILPLSEQEKDMLWKYRQFDARDQLDIRELIEMKYFRISKRGTSSGSRSGGRGSEEEAATKEYA